MIINLFNSIFLSYYYDAFWGTFCIIGLISFVVWIVIAIWIYGDANIRGEHGGIWVIIILLTGIIGLIIWLCIRPPIKVQMRQQLKEPDRLCPECKKVIPFDANICPYCGRKF